MATSSAQRYVASTANKGSGTNRKRALENDKEFSNPPAKVRKVANHSHDTPHLGSNPATHHLQHKKDDPTQVNETGADTDDEESDREKSSDTTGDKCPSTPKTTPSTTPNTTPNTTPDTTPRKRSGDSWWYRAGTKVVVYKRDDFTGRIRPRRMMDDMYANASPEKMKKYRQYHFRYMCRDATASSEDLDDSEYSDDDSEDGSDIKEGDASENENDSGDYDGDDEGDDGDDEGEGTKRSEGGDEEEGQDQDQDQDQDQEQEQEDEDVIEDEESEDEPDDDYEDKEGEGDEDYDEE
ncbi:hypothetical protein F4809DRAFT_170328 [Biscogniauxia mediterranea]|nr:hypothetical protein F4809DRAFT_170328 [Biscogniauxia mediterranea]